MKKIYDILDVDLDINIYGITDDSRLVKSGYLFVATKGYNVDHYNFIDDAVKNGASFIITDRDVLVNVPYFVVEDVDINKFYIDCCKKYYDVDINCFDLIGITGTDGKTTTANIIYQLLDRCAYLGTNGLYVNEIKEDTSNTTPCVSELYNCFNIIKNNCCKVVSMEVSSEALLHRRVEGLKFKIIGFTNITGDHLNIHNTIDEYRKCKFTLTEYLCENGIVFVNGDDYNCKLLECQNMYSYGFNCDNDFVIKDVKYMSNFVCFSICFGDVIYKIKSPFLEKYNIYNVTLSFLICLYYGINSEILINNISKLDFIDGRGEYLDFGQNFDIILDYAHTVNGVKSILESVLDYDKIIVVTGAAGGRDKEKRKFIGEIIFKYADEVIFTMDDPRYENVNDIIDDMVGNNTCEYYRIIDRTLAIEKAFSLASLNSVVLILGKGRDKYMLIKDEKIPYCDYDVVKNFFL